MVRRIAAMYVESQRVQLVVTPLIAIAVPVLFLGFAIPAFAIFGSQNPYVLVLISIPLLLLAHAAFLHRSILRTWRKWKPASQMAGFLTMLMIGVAVLFLIANVIPHGPVSPPSDSPLTEYWENFPRTEFGFPCAALFILDPDNRPESGRIFTDGISAGLNLIALGYVLLSLILVASLLFIRLRRFASPPIPGKSEEPLRP